MKIIFDEIFTVKIHHSYYTSTFSEDFDVVPTQACRRLLRNYGLLFRTTAQGFAVYYEAIEDNSQVLHPVRPIAEKVRFSFQLISKNSYLINYSDLPIDLDNGAIYYLSNLNDNQQNGELLLSADTNAEFVSGTDALKFRPLAFTYHYETEGSLARFELYDEWSNAIVAETKKVVEGVVDYRIDLGGYGPGKYMLFIDGIKIEDFYAGANHPAGNLFGFIDILRHEMVPGGYRFTNPSQDHDVTARTYVVRVNNRKTFWRYYLALKNRSRYPSPENWPADWPDDWIIEHSAAPAFQLQPQPESLHTLADGTVSVPFVSATELPLQQQALKDIQLKKSPGNGQNGIHPVDHLPNPSIASIVPDQAENKIYSEVIVYI